MWRQTRLLDALTALCLTGALAMLLAALTIVWLRILPVQSVVLTAPLVRVTRAEIAEALQGRLGGNFMTFSLNRVRASLESLPWVRHASARRVWPNRLVITLTEQQPIARWGDSGREWVNPEGDVFAANLPVGLQSSLPDLPRLSGPPGTSAYLLDYYTESGQLLAPLELAPVSLTLSERLALEMSLSNGMVLRLGREEMDGVSSMRRLRRFIAAYPRFVASRQRLPASVDLRYSNGFALSPN
ncbi:MAG: FtsQ-type POTRA domain-containing protein [Zoogloeaceae bacterium]|jgi:cell division protein FtsQ|nr:FtsQ-type POTRA domain-containing protein [Zoogloeaceae bacterium]